MSVDDNTNTNPSTNFGPKGEVSQEFNQHKDEVQLLNSLSPEGRKYYLATKQEGEREMLEAEKKQRQSRVFRLIKAENKLFRKYMKTPALRPTGAQADIDMDIKILEEQAKRDVRHQDASRLNNIKNEKLADLDHIIEWDRAQKNRSGAQQNHSEQEQER
ncbi:hypothetical protein NBRC116602_07020 [Hyphomicrobiales bacterium 4NK60-0047b]